MHYLTKKYITRPTFKPYIIHNVSTATVYMFILVMYTAFNNVLIALYRQIAN